jgi:hypothetical protein
VIVAPGFVLLHLHKSGGSFANAAVLRFVPGARQIGHHLPRRLLPDAARELPVVGFVRNPLGYYLSWYSFQRARPQPNALFRLLSDGGRLGFRDTIHRMLDLAGDDALLARACAALPADYDNRGLNLPGPALERIRGTAHGFYSFLFHHLFDAPGAAPLVGRMENLRDALPALLREAGYAPPPAFDAFVATAAPVNVSTHGTIDEAYDAPLAARVREADASLFDAFGYDAG